MERGGNIFWFYLCVFFFFSILILDMKWKNKFWGKFLEIVFVGIVNVSLFR